MRESQKHEKMSDLADLLDTTTTNSNCGNHTCGNEGEELGSGLFFSSGTDTFNITNITDNSSCSEFLNASAAKATILGTPTNPEPYVGLAVAHLLLILVPTLLVSILSLYLVSTINRHPSKVAFYWLSSVCIIGVCSYSLLMDLSLLVDAPLMGSCQLRWVGAIYWLVHSALQTSLLWIYAFSAVLFCLSIFRNATSFDARKVNAALAGIVTFALLESCLWVFLTEDYVERRCQVRGSFCLVVFREGARKAVLALEYLRVIVAAVPVYVGVPVSVGLYWKEVKRSVVELNRTMSRSLTNISVSLLVGTFLWTVPTMLVHLVTYRGLERPYASLLTTYMLQLDYLFFPAIIITLHKEMRLRVVHGCRYLWCRLTCRTPPSHLWCHHSPPGGHAPDIELRVTTAAAQELPCPVFTPTSSSLLPPSMSKRFRLPKMAAAAESTPAAPPPQVTTPTLGHKSTRDDKIQEDRVPHPLPQDVIKIEILEEEPRGCGKVPPLSPKVPKHKVILEVVEEQEVPKQEAPKQEVPKQVVSKQEVPKQEVPKQEASQQVVSKQKVPQQAAVKQQVAQQAVSKQEVAKRAVSKQEVAEEEMPSPLKVIPKRPVSLPIRYCKAEMARQRQQKVREPTPLSPTPSLTPSFPSSSEEKDTDEDEFHEMPDIFLRRVSAPLEETHKEEGRQLVALLHGRRASAPVYGKSKDPDFQ